MVASPEEYPWSSYRAHVGLDECDWLDVDPCTAGLANSRERQQARYREFVRQGIHKHEIEFIRGAVQRNQLTGSESFILKVEQLTGERILYRTRGRPRAER